MAKGYKTCPNCGESVGPRTKVCPKCGQAFGFTPKRLRPEKVKSKKINDWHLLREGDLIKVSSNSPNGYYGKFKVKSIDDDGVVAYPVDANESGACYIFFGEPRQTQFGTTLLPHKVSVIETTSV